MPRLNPSRKGGRRARIEKRKKMKQQRAQTTDAEVESYDERQGHALGGKRID